MRALCPPRPAEGDTRYTGIDINPDYIAQANRRFGGGVHDHGRPPPFFADASYDGAISIATCHHLEDALVRLMIREAMRVIRPVVCFTLLIPYLGKDRGRHQRTLCRMQALVAETHPIADQDFRSGLLHDVAYFGLRRS
jgi:hypothetical protein